MAMTIIFTAGIETTIIKTPPLRVDGVRRDVPLALIGLLHVPERGDAMHL
jgi:hypothetical protein